MSAETLTIWLALIAGGSITYATRLSFILFFSRREPPAGLLRALRFVPAAVLSAIIFTELLLRDQALWISPGNPRLVAGVLAALVAWRTRNVLLTLVAGMAALWILQVLAG
jgi:branched-subunit amino acid transport protein